MKNKLFLLLLTLIASTTTSWAQEVIFNYIESRGYEVGNDHESTNFADLSSESLPWCHDGVWTNNSQSLVGNEAQTFYRPSYSGNAFEQFDWITLKFTTPSYSRIVYNLRFNTFLRHYRLWRAFRIAYFDYGTDINNYWADRNKDPQGNDFIATALTGGDRSGTQWNNDVKNGESGAFYHYGDDNPYGVETRWSDIGLPSVTIDNRNSETEHKITRYGGFSFSKTNGDVYTSKGPNYINVTMYCPCDIYFYKYVTFNPNGGTGSSMAVQTVENSANLSKNTYTRPGYVFVGWATNANGTGVVYADKGAITATLESKGPVTLYAQWEKISTTDTEGGVIYNENATVTPADVEAMLNDPTTGTIPVVDLSKATVSNADAIAIVNKIRGNEKGKNAFIILPAGTDISNLPTTDNVNIIIGDQCENLHLIDQTPMESSVQNRRFTAKSATYVRAQGNEWGTVCLPFALQSDQTIQYYTLATVSGSSMWFNPIQNVDANTPAVFRRLAGNEINVSDTNAPIYVNGTETENTDATNWQLKGTYKPVVISNQNGNLYYIAQNQFWNATQSANNVKVPAYRAYFETTTPVSARSFTLFIGDGDSTTEIGTINADGTIETAPVYNIAGQRLSITTKGINIINGKKIIK